ncbi:type II toxin-antitoxin system HicB family antitoxin [Anaeromassilibacillus sp. SJQ-1]|uniref:type II toxin-antitoxin system HicB family antitoxin n=1 Tax=unclassified Anaeromassilibacillus TaxID=2625359 RepID=UPI00117818CE|nr:type II toxin-antitoxin system HicB family antitoxin [Clostridiales bacterium]
MVRCLYTAVFSPHGDGGYITSVPDIPGCITGGVTLDEAVSMVCNVMAGCLCVLEDQHVEIPSACAP